MMSDPATNPHLAPRYPRDSDATLVEQWAAIEDAARVVSLLAGRRTPSHDARAEAAVVHLKDVDPDRAEAAILSLSELVAMMRAGLDALLAAHGTAANPRPAAERLWQEYERGRAAVLAEIARASRTCVTAA